MDYLSNRIYEVKIIGSYGIAQGSFQSGKKFAMNHQIQDLRYLSVLPDEGSIEIGVIKKSLTNTTKINSYSTGPVNLICENGIQKEEKPSKPDPYMTVDQILMWFDVTPFSPFSPYRRISPF